MTWRFGIRRSSRIRGHAASLERLLTALLFICFVLVSLITFAAFRAAQRSDRETDVVMRIYRGEVLTGEARQLIEQVEAIRRGFLLTADRNFLRRHQQAMLSLGRVLRSLAQQPDLARDIARISRVEAAARRLADDQAKTIALVGAGRIDEARLLFRQRDGVATIRDARASLETLSRELASSLERRDQAQREARRDFFRLAAGVALMIGLIVLLSAALAVSTIRQLRRSGRRLDTANASLRNLADTLEERVAARTSELERANAEIQRFAYIVSHDLRAPLVNIIGFTGELTQASATLQTLAASAGPDGSMHIAEDHIAATKDILEAVEFIRASTQKMDRLIRAILRLAREGQRRLQPETIDSGVVAAGLVAAMRRTLDERGATVEIAPAMPVLSTDRLALEQILLNLIDNAGKYRRLGCPLEIAVSGIADPCLKTATIAVSDTGRGIDQGDLDRIFELFRRAGRQDEPGEGIGLAHVRALVQRLGGRISVESTLGRGSVFRVTLPLRLDHDPEESRRL